MKLKCFKLKTKRKVTKLNWEKRVKPVVKTPHKCHNITIKLTFAGKNKVKVHFSTAVLFRNFTFVIFFSKIMTNFDNFIFYDRLYLNFLKISSISRFPPDIFFENATRQKYRWLPGNEVTLEIKTQSNLNICKKY